MECIPVYERPVSQVVSNEYPHYLAVMENGRARAISVWAVRQRPNPSGDSVDQSRIECEPDTGEVFTVDRERLCNTPAGAIASLTRSILAEMKNDFKTSLDHGNREIFAALSETITKYVTAEIDAAWCQLKIERMAEERANTNRDKVLGICRDYTERRLSVFGDHVGEQLFRRTIQHVDTIHSAFSERLANVEGKIGLLSEILKPAKTASTKTPKVAKTSKRKQ